MTGCTTSCMGEHTKLPPPHVEGLGRKSNAMHTQHLEVAREHGAAVARRFTEEAIMMSCTTIMDGTLENQYSTALLFGGATYSTTTVKLAVWNRCTSSYCNLLLRGPALRYLYNTVCTVLYTAQHNSTTALQSPVSHLAAAKKEEPFLCCKLHLHRSE